MRFCLVESPTCFRKMMRSSAKVCHPKRVCNNDIAFNYSRDATRKQYLKRIETLV
jgi:hypothetical protein